MVGFYLTAGLFVFVVLGLIARCRGLLDLPLPRLHQRRAPARARHQLLRDGAARHDAARLQRLGCAEATVGLVIPTGYSFNLDGTNIYMTMAAVFLAQATNTPLDLGQQISLLLVAMISSKGASGVTGAGFITLAATLAAVPEHPDRERSRCSSASTAS